MSLVKKYPIPAAGLILAIFALGNRLQAVHPYLKTVLGIIGGILYVLYLLKLVLDFTNVRAELKKPPVASVFPTITMATMLIATYVKPISAGLANAFWWVGFVGHLLLIVWFTASFVAGFTIRSVFPSWFIVYVGIAVAGVTAPVVGQWLLGQLSFWFGLVAFAILLPTVLYRVWVVRDMPPPTLPSLVIIAAPASLLLAAYMNAFPEKSLTLSWILIGFSLALYAIALYYLARLIVKPFMPTMSGFTFPVVISAVAIAAANGFLAKAGHPAAWLQPVATAQLIVASAVVLYVLIGYVRHLLARPQAN